MALMIRASKENEVLIRKKAEELGESANAVANKMISDVEYHKKRREASFRECKKVKRQNEQLTNSINLVAMRNCIDANSLLNEVLEYRNGEGKYDLSHIKHDLRENEAFDLWLDLESRIKTYLHSASDRVTKKL